MTKKPNKYENKDSFKDKLKAKKLVEKWEDTYLKRYNSGIPLNRLILLKKNYSHIEQYRDFLICKAARGKRNIIKDKEKAELGDLYIDKQGKLECYLGYKWFTLSDIKNKEFKPDEKIIKKLEESKSSKLFKAKKYKLPKIVTTILKEKASEINKLFMGKEKFNIFNDHFNENIYTTISDIYRKAQVLIYEEYEEQMNDINRKSTERRVFSQKMKDFCLVQVEKHCEKLKSKIKEKNFNNKNIENLIEKTNNKEKNPIKIKLLEDKDYSETEKAFLLKYISPQGYYSWNKIAESYIEKSKNYDGTKLFQVFSAPAYYLTKELTEAFLNTPVNNIKPEKKPEVINNQFFLIQPLNTNEIAYSFIDASATKQIRNNLSYDIVIKSYFNINKNECRFNRKTGVTLPKFKNRCKLNSIKFNWNNLNNITTCKGVLPFDELTSIEQEQFLIVVNLILFMNQEPDITLEYVTPSVFTRQKNQEIDRNSFKPRAVTWIGKEFTQRIIKVKQINDGEVIKEGCRPVRSHWRRGHWHTVLQGFKRRERKMKWYRPVFVRGNKL